MAEQCFDRIQETPFVFLDEIAMNQRIPIRRELKDQVVVRHDERTSDGYINCIMRSTGLRTASSGGDSGCSSSDN